MQDQDRRKYFRIEQKVSLELKAVSEEEMAQSPRPVQFEVSPYFLLLSQLQELDAESNSLLRKIAEKDANIAAFLHILHSKVETIAKAVAASGIALEHIVTQEINLSEGGMMFSYPHEIPLGSNLALKLIFPESCIGLLLYAQVCRLIPEANGEYHIGVAFTRLPESCRQILARQIFASQTLARQLERQTEQLNNRHA